MKNFEVDSDNPAAVVFRQKHLMVNSYLLGRPGDGNWVALDAGLTRYCARNIFRQSAERFGRGTIPAAIILTHGHFDHVGAIFRMIERWQVPVYAHEAELPFLTGRADYQRPGWRAGGGFMAWTSFLLPNRGIDLGNRVQALPADGTVPGLPEWRWIHTPGHSPGHISLYREQDRALIPGDAFVTQKQESFWAVLTQARKVHRPPAYFTPDWDSAQCSVEKLAALNPRVATSGHGRPMAGEALKRGLDRLLERFEQMAMPRHVVRWRHQPAQFIGAT